MTDPAVTDPAVPQRRLAPSGAHVGLLGLLGLLAALVTLLVSLLAAPTASASPLIGAGNAVAPIAVPVGQPVGPHEAVLAGQGQARAPAYDQTAVGSCVGTEDQVPFSQMERVGQGLSSDVYHRAASWVVDDPAAQPFTFTGGDGVQRNLYQLPGEVDGKPGVFEWIIDSSDSDPVITHQRFIPGGEVTGYPNQRP